MKWNNGEVIISIIKPDIKCDDGVIHVINRPLLKVGDISLKGDDSGAENIHNVSFIVLLFWIVYFL